MEFLGWLIAVTIALMAYSRAGAARRDAQEADSELRTLRNALENLGRHVTELRNALDALRSGTATEADAPPPVVTPPVVEEAPPVETVEPQPAAPAIPETVAASEEVPPAETTPPPVEMPAAELPHAAREAAPPPPPPPVAPPPPPKPPFDWESLIGVQLFSWIAGIALVLAAIFFLRYGIEHNWLGPRVQAAIAVLAGSTLIFVCELRVARDYKSTANALHGAGIAILYAAFFAMHARWHLAPAAVAFPLMILVTAVAVWLSIRRESVFIALLGLVGGFSTPALLSTGENRPIPLFAYLLLLNAGLAWVAYRRRWTALTAVSIGFTAIYQWAWVAKFLSASQLPLAAGIFLLFAITAATALWLGRRDDDKQPLFDHIGIAGAALPLLFATFAAAVPAYGHRYNVLFGFLLLMVAGLAAIAFFRATAWLHLLGGVATLLVFVLWRSVSFDRLPWPAVLIWISAFFVLYLAVAIRFRTPAMFVAPLLLVFFPTFVSYAERPWLLFGFLFVLLAAAAAFSIAFEEGLVYFIGAFAAVGTEAVWSARFLTHERLISGLALYGIFGLFFLGVPIVARTFKRRLEPRGAISVLVLLSIAILFFLAGGTVANAALWGLALLLGILNAGALAEARTTSHPLLAVFSMILSWIVIAVWWGAATIMATLVPALMVVGMFSVLVIAGNVWASASKNDNAPTFENGTYLALVGHLFLGFVATQPALALPPWPLFGVLAVLDLALGVGALWLHRARLITAAIAASQGVLLMWTLTAAHGPWQNTALLATLAVTALAMLWYRLDRRFELAPVGGAILAELVAVAAARAAYHPSFALLVATHALLLLAMFVVAWASEQHSIVTVAAITTILTINATPLSPVRQLLFATTVYALFVAYPLLLGRRAKASTHPYLSAVIASGVFFFAAYDSLVHLGYKPFIGALPVAQAIITLLLLLRLLQIERDATRLLSRLALVAGAALAFITLAIPLQLDKQWITIGWALEGAALAWLFGRIPHRGLLAWSAALLAVVFVRLTFNRAVFLYHPRSSTAIVNWYLYAYLVCAAAMFLAAYFWPREFVKQAIAALNAGGTVLLFFLLNIEIADYFSTGPTLTFNFFSSSLAQDLTYTIGWALFAVAMLIAGIMLAQRAVRVAAILLLSVTIAKCFLHDLGRLGGLYRVVSLLGLAASLVLVGILLQKFVIRKAEAQPEATPA